MLELALHILDIAENSVRAIAKTVWIEITEDRGKDRLSLVIRDDGKGMSKAVLEKVMDPFYTSKKVRRVGLGLPMLGAGNPDRRGIPVLPYRSPAAGGYYRRHYRLDRRQ
jgi:anti-sigma regulatory factor (Ser/Thr protein kinase)